MSKFFAVLLIIFKVSRKLFWRSNKIIFRSISSKIVLTLKKFILILKQCLF